MEKPNYGKQILDKLGRNNRNHTRLSVDAIVKTLTETVANLELHSTERDGQLNRLDAEMKKLESEKQIAVVEKNRGEKIRENISKLLDT